VAQRSARRFSQTERALAGESKPAEERSSSLVDDVGGAGAAEEGVVAGAGFFRRDWNQLSTVRTLARPAAWAMRCFSAEDG
jgi:hypothetical protein